MPSLQFVSSKGKKYFRIVKSVRVDGKPRPVPICYLGTVDHILEVFENFQKGKSPANSENQTIENIEIGSGNRPDKTLQWITKSRDIWKDKCQKSKAQLKVKTLAVKRLQETRDNLKLNIEEADSTIKVLQEKLKNAEKLNDKLQSQVEDKDEQIDNLKKK